MIRWPLRAAGALSRLFRPLQDIDIFIEDQGDEIFYSELFGKVVGKDYRIERVIALGGAANVVERARTYNGTRRALFLIDGDLAWLRGDPVAGIPRLHRLPMYCIENALLREQFIVEIACEEWMCSSVDAANKLQFDTWKDSMLILVKLFVRFAVLNRLDDRRRTVSGSFGGLLTGAGRRASLCEVKTAAAIEAVEADIRSMLSESDAAAAIARVARRVEEFDNKLDAISGKSYLLPLLLYRLKGESPSNMSKNNLRFRLARKMSYTDLPALRDALQSAA